MLESTQARNGDRQTRPERRESRQTKRRRHLRTIDEFDDMRRTWLEL